MFAANVHGKMFTANIGISIKHNYLHMNHNLLDFGDGGEAWHAIWSGHGGGGALTYARLPPDPQNPKYCDSYVKKYVLWISQLV